MGLSQMRISCSGPWIAEHGQEPGDPRGLPTSRDSIPSAARYTITENALTVGKSIFQMVRTPEEVAREHTDQQAEGALAGKSNGKIGGFRLYQVARLGYDRRLRSDKWKIPGVALQPIFNFGANVCTGCVRDVHVVYGVSMQSVTTCWLCATMLAQQILTRAVGLTH